MLESAYRGNSICDIAAILGVNKSTLYRELARNTGQRGYRFQQAQEMALERKNAQLEIVSN
jgi:transposase, IS30 family